MEIYSVSREVELLNIQIIFVIFMVLFLNLVYRAYKQGDFYAGIYKIGLAGFFLCNAINFVIRFLDLYYPSFFYINLLIYSRILIITGVTFLLASLEVSKMLETKGIVTATFAIFTIIINIVAASSRVVTLISSLIHIIIPIIYFYFAIKEKGIVKYQIFFNGLGILIILIGSTLRPSDIRAIFPNVARTLENIFQIPFEIFLFAMIYLGLLLIMIFDIDFEIKLQWAEKIRSVYLITHSKNIILEKNLKGELISLQDLEANGMDVNGLIEKLDEDIISKFDKFDILRRYYHSRFGDKEIYSVQGEHLIGILVADEGLRLLPHKLGEFVKDVEDLFKDILPKWDGTDFKIFKPAYILLNRHLSMEY
ncbi:MAG: hypothetical protein ACTSRG_01425 [Candidatus Helarchaeota archaeon]